MSHAASGGSGPTNETSNEKGGTNEGNNKNRNGHHSESSGKRYSTYKFKGKVEGLSNLGVKEDKHMYSFMILHKEFHACTLANYKRPSDIAYLVK